MRPCGAPEPAPLPLRNCATRGRARAASVVDREGWYTIRELAMPTDPASRISLTLGAERIGLLRREAAAQGCEPSTVVSRLIDEWSLGTAPRPMAAPSSEASAPAIHSFDVLSKQVADATATRVAETLQKLVRPERQGDGDLGRLLAEVIELLRVIALRQENDFPALAPPA